MDATNEVGRLGRLVNHSRTEANVSTKVMELDGKPHWCLIAKKDIQIGNGLQFDYGDRRRVVTKSFPWLASILYIIVPKDQLYMAKEIVLVHV